MPTKWKMTERKRLLTMQVTPQDQEKIHAAMEKLGMQSVAETIRALLGWFLAGKK